MPKKETKQNRKHTNEKPVSLYPVEVDDVLRSLLNTPPLKEQTKKKRKSRKKKSG